MRIQLNRIVRGMQGVLDDVIYKRFEGRTIAVPKGDPFTGPPTAAQLRVRDRFKLAAAFAKRVLADPARAPIYQSAAKAVGRQSVNAVVMTDFLIPPRVTEIDLSHYDGAIGNEIQVTAVDDFEVVSVEIAIKDAGGNELESGPATKGDTRWTYAS